MSKQYIEELEAAIAEIEKKMDEDDEFADGDEFETLREELNEKLDYIQLFEIDAFPHDTASDAMEERFYLFRKRFEKCKKRVEKIDDTADRDDGTGDWMGDRDDDDLID